MASSRTRSSSCSFLTLLLSFFNFILFTLSAASFAPTIALRMPPAPLGWAFLAISSVSILSSFVGFYSHLARFCFVAHLSLLLASSAGQLLGILELFTKERSSLEMLRSARDPREAKVLVRLECGILMAMLMMQLGVLILSCAVQSCWDVREYEGLEAGRDAAAAMKRRQRLARVQEETTAETMKSREIDEKMISKYGKWNSNDF